MLSAVLDSSVLVSAFLTAHGLAAHLVAAARQREFSLSLSEQILAETQDVLLNQPHIRKRYPYTDEQAARFCRALRSAASLVTPLPGIHGVVRDPNDDHVVACALAASVGYLVTRDPDLLTLKVYHDVQMITPVNFMRLLREDAYRNKSD
jgi:putative PIN family toxin of toxin-antitoxin system